MKIIFIISSLFIATFANASYTAISVTDLVDKVNAESFEYIGRKKLFLIIPRSPVFI